MKTLSRAFFERPTLTVAQELLGKVLVFHDIQGIITETEAYIGEDDPACHAARGLTPRTTVMYGLPGYSYIYLIYGMYHCLNIVTEMAGYPAAVLLRGLQLTDSTGIRLDGPGKLCRHLGLTRAHNQIDLTTTQHFFVSDCGLNPQLIETTPRIGIRVGTDKLWRFLGRF